MKWTEIERFKDYVAKSGTRLFRLHLADHGVLAIGSAFYLTTKLQSETEWKSLDKVFVVSDDNHGSVKRSHLEKFWTTHGKGSWTPEQIDIPSMKKEVEKIAAVMF